MKFETFKRNHKTGLIVGAIGFISIALIGIFAVSFAKYKNAESIPLVRGTLNYTSGDFNLVAVYLENASGGYDSVKNKIPTHGYELITTGTGENVSACYVGKEKDTKIAITYANGEVSFSHMTQPGTKCNLYFARDKEAPVVNDFTAEVTGLTIAVTVNASDNIGVAKYYYVINGGTPVEKDTNTYTFSGLTAGQSYEITVYVSDGINESVRKTKTVVAGATGESTLAKLGVTVSSGTPNFSKTSCSNGCGEATVGVYSAIDDTGKTSYYYRGDVTNNYLKFAGKYWRIIRINGDGTIRIIYDGTEYHANGTDTSDSIAVASQKFNTSYNNAVYVGFKYGTTEEGRGLTNKSSALTQLETWYTNNLASYADYIDTNAGFCGDRTAYTDKAGTTAAAGYGTTTQYFADYVRLYTNKAPVLTCANSDDLYTVTGASQGNKSLEYPIGLINANEVAMAGGLYNTSNSEYYLYNGQNYWTMSPCDFISGYEYVFFVHNDGRLNSQYVDLGFGLRPVINLRADVKITGSGVQGDEYEVS